MEVNSAVGRADGIPAGDLAALGEFERSPAFSERERAALAYAEAMVAGHVVGEEVYARLRAHFAEDEIVELTAVAVWEIAVAKFNRALEIEGRGICPLP